MKKEWDPNEYQGRSQKKVERNYRVFAISIVLGWLGLFGLLIYKLINFLF